MPTPQTLVRVYETLATTYIPRRTCLGHDGVVTTAEGAQQATRSAARPTPTWVGTSWKMTKSRREAVAWVDVVSEALVAKPAPGVMPFVLPSATALAEVSVAARGEGRPGNEPLLVGAQNAHWEEQGSWTGELAVSQVADAGARLVEVGHSERRVNFGETDAIVRLKVAAVLRHGLVPILCVGEPAQVREAGRHREHVTRQVDLALEGLGDTSSVLVAYEPVWAIGDRGREARPEQVAPVVEAVMERWHGHVAAILYGGSVNEGNAAALLEVHGVDGLFAGRSAWAPAGFLRLVDIAATVHQARGSSTA